MTRVLTTAQTRKKGGRKLIYLQQGLISTAHDYRVLTTAQTRKKGGRKLIYIQQGLISTAHD